MPNHSLPQVTGPSDELIRRAHATSSRASELQTVQRDLLQPAPSGPCQPWRHLAHPRALGQWLNSMNRLAAASVIEANAACRGGQQQELGTRREWCPASLVVPAALRRSGRTETLTRPSHTSDDQRIPSANNQDGEQPKPDAELEFLRSSSSEVEARRRTDAGEVGCPNIYQQRHPAA